MERSWLTWLGAAWIVKAACTVSKTVRRVPPVRTQNRPSDDVWIVATMCIYITVPIAMFREQTHHQVQIPVTTVCLQNANILHGIIEIVSQYYTQHCH